MTTIRTDEEIEKIVQKIMVHESLSFGGKSHLLIPLLLEVLLDIRRLLTNNQTKQ